MIINKAYKKPVQINWISFPELAHNVKFGTTELNINNHKILPRVKDITGEPVFLIPTLEGEMEMTINDVLIVGIKGEIYPCKISIFKESYNYDVEQFENAIRRKLPWD